MPEPEILPEMAVAVREQPQQAVSLWGATEPSEVLVRAEKVASSLKDVIKRQGLISNIQGKEYPRCEAWTLLGTMIGVFPVLCWSRPVEHGWEARVEARTRDGAIVGAAEAQCLKTERNWKDRDDFALRSMAQTRATAKALRMPLGFVMTLAGYESTPAEEMTHEMAKTPYKPPQGKITQAKAPDAPKANVERSKPPTEATKEQRDRFLAALKPVAGAALQYAVEHAWILDTEELEDIPLDKVPTTQKQFQSIMDGIRVLMDGDQIPGAEVPPDKDDWDNQRAIAEQESLEIQEPDEPWRDIIVPFGKNKGERFGALEKGQLWWWCVKWQPEDWTDKKGKTHPPSDSDLELRKTLDEVRAKYKFTDTKKG